MSSPRALPSAVLQTAAVLAAHVAAAGCLPSARGLVLAVPATVVAVLLLTRLLDARPLAALAAGQLAGHGALALAAACVGHAHATSSPMALAHVAAVVLLRLAGDRALAAVAAGLAHLRVLLLAVPALRLPAAGRALVTAPARAPRRTALRVVHLRGPPAGALAR